MRHLLTKGNSECLKRNTTCTRIGLQLFLRETEKTSTVNLLDVVVDDTRGSREPMPSPNLVASLDKRPDSNERRVPVWLASEDCKKCASGGVRPVRQPVDATAQVL